MNGHHTVKLIYLDRILQISVHQHWQVLLLQKVRLCLYTFSDSLMQYPFSILILNNHFLGNLIEKLSRLYFESHFLLKNVVENLYMLWQQVTFQEERVLQLLVCHGVSETCEHLVHVFPQTLGLKDLVDTQDLVYHV